MPPKAQRFPPPKGGGLFRATCRFSLPGATLFQRKPTLVPLSRGRPPEHPSREVVVRGMCARPPPILLEHDRLLFKASGWNNQKEYQKGPFHAVWPNLIGQVRDDRHRGLCPDYVHAVYSWSSRPLQVLSKRLCVRFVVVEKMMLF